MVGASASGDGKSGLVPTPLQGEQDFILAGSGEWKNALTFVDSNIFNSNSNGKITLKDFTTANDGLIPQKVNGELTWVDPTTLISTQTLSFTPVTDIADIDVTAADANSHIYLVNNSSGDNTNSFDEYIVVNGALERIGSVANTVDLNGYLQTANLPTELINVGVGDLSDLLVTNTGDTLVEQVNYLTEHLRWTEIINES